MNELTVSPVGASMPARMTNPLDLSPAEFRQALARRSENRKALMEWIRSSLVDGVDFGAVPLRRGGFSKPSLRKPGAEKICGMLGVTATFPTLKDYEALALDGRDVSQVIIRCHLHGPNGEVVADGVGARSLEQDYGDLNKALKMALKSAQIDATLRMGGLSEVFTQDLEDMPHAALEEGQGAAPSQQQRPHAPPQAERPCTDRQAKLLHVKLSQAGIPESEFLEKFGIADIGELPFSKVNPALHWIAGVAAA